MPISGKSQNRIHDTLFPKKVCLAPVKCYGAAWAKRKLDPAKRNTRMSCDRIPASPLIYVDAGAWVYVLLNLEGGLWPPNFIMILEFCCVCSKLVLSCHLLENGPMCCYDPSM